ncbi:hypothetical protein HN014_10895 [Aquimarina sp. TRL1]|uniref:hypothetical protein n=1 Tax=Aquimarina sp. (strain TRL1) TaxID=2736252 RepID=UPI00158D9285|nr:hypothetical protein [Aquimarina sp. TRL1]QKX05400.1 hypothetical protein HN014_10895 [Aquimarina sp. TRL1]
MANHKKTSNYLMLTFIKKLLSNKTISNSGINTKIYTKCGKLLEDYTEEQLLAMYGKEKTAFIKNNPDKWI